MNETSNINGISYDTIAAANQRLQKYSQEKGSDCPKNLTEYVSVSQRVKAFRMVCPAGGIMTEEESCAEGYIKFRATLISPDGFVLATGTAIKQLNKWNKYDKKWEYDPDALTKCETKAVGRALAFMGLGIDCGIASAEDMAEFNNSQLQQAVANIQPQAASTPAAQQYAPQGQAAAPDKSLPPAYQPAQQGYAPYRQPAPSGYYAS